MIRKPFTGRQVLLQADPFDNPNDPDRGDVHYWKVWHETVRFLSTGSTFSAMHLSLVSGASFPKDH